MLRLSTLQRLTCAVLGGVLALAGAVPAAAAADPADWTHTGFNPAERTITTRNAGALRYRWSIVSPVVSGGRLYVTTGRILDTYRP